MKPLIGITMTRVDQESRTLHSVDLDYGKAILQAGGIPVPLLGFEQAIPDMVRRLDGFLFTGGDDIHPRFYRERPLPGVPLRIDSPDRVRFEMKLFRAAVKAKKPVLAICYGAQLANVALGGTLYQDIKRQLPKALKHGGDKGGTKVIHPVDIFEGTRLCEIMGKCSDGNCTVRVRSSHHQSIKNPGRGLRLAAVSPDGVYEALESRDRSFLIAVQWHPEKTPGDKATKKLFTALVNASRA